MTVAENSGFGSAVPSGLGNYKASLLEFYLLICKTVLIMESKRNVVGIKLGSSSYMASTVPAT